MKKELAKNAEYKIDAQLFGMKIAETRLRYIRAKEKRLFMAGFIEAMKYYRLISEVKK